MKGETEMCAGDALIGYGKDLRGIGSELCCCGKELIGYGKGQARRVVHRRIIDSFSMATETDR